MTLDSLATQLAVRLNTVWSFKHKVVDSINELQKRGKKPTASRWEEVIFTDSTTIPVQSKIALKNTKLKA